MLLSNASAGADDAGASSDPSSASASSFHSIKRLLTSMTWSSVSPPTTSVGSSNSPVNSNKKQRLNPSSSPPSLPISSSDPWDYSSYLSRLSTFSPLNWFAAPLLLSPPEVARYGWTAIQQGTLHCSNCNSSFTVDSATLLSSSSDHSISQRISCDFSSRHVDSCIWMKTHSPHLFLSLPRDNSILHYQVNQRLETLKSVCISFDALNEQFCNEWKFACNEQQEESLRDKINENWKLAIAVCGWTGEENSTHLTCSFCSQSLDLSLYSSSSSSSSSFCSSFDPSVEHRFFCIFSPPLPEFPSSSSHDSQSNNSSNFNLPGWRRVFSGWLSRERLLSSAAPSSAEELKQKTIENVRKLIFLME
jgi:hypothetical protein